MVGLLGKRLAMLVVMLTSFSNSHAANYVIDSNQTNVRFAIDNLKTSVTTGGFYNVKGQLQYDALLRTGSVALIIPIKSLDTGNKAFNLKLTSADFFDTQRFPSATFTSTQWHFNDNKLGTQVTQIDGKLTLHGETHPISLKATKFNCALSTTINKDVCAGGFTATIDRTKWNIKKYTLFGITKDLTLNIQVKAIRQ